MTFSRCKTTLALAATLASLGAQAGLVTFDPVDEQGSTLAAGDAITAMGFNFTQFNAAPATLFAGDLVGAYASNGSNTLFAGNAAEIVLTAAGGGLFNLASLEVGGGNLGDLTTWATELQLFGLTANNMTLMSTVQLDPNSMGLAMVGLSNFTNLTQVSFRVAAGDFSLDNLRLQAVPEPASWALIALALVGVGVSRRRGH